jgi:hypothetical protein
MNACKINAIRALRRNRALEHTCAFRHAYCRQIVGSFLDAIIPRRDWRRLSWGKCSPCESGCLALLARTPLYSCSVPW